MKTRASGFSLVELLVVLVIFGLVSALALPNLSATYTSLSYRGELEELEISLSALGHHAFLENESIEVLDSEGLKDWVSVPEGWSIQVVEPLIVRSNGVCLGGEIRLLKQDFSKRIRLTMPHCSLVDV